MQLKLEKLFYQLPGLTIRYRWFVVAAYVLLIAFAYIGAGKEWRDDSLKSWFGTDSEIYRDLNHFENVFGSNEDLYIVYRAKDGDIFSKSSLEALSKLHNELANYPLELKQNPDSPMGHIREVISLINVQVTKVNGDNLSMSSFIGNKLPDSDKERKRLKHQALNNPDLLLNFASKDAQYGGISIKTDFGINGTKVKTKKIDDDLFLDFSLDSGGNIQDNTEEVVDSGPRDYEEYLAFMDAVRKHVEKSDIGNQLEVNYVGLPEIVAFQTSVLDSELGKIFLGLFVIMFVLLFILFRHLSAVVWPLTIIILTLLFTLGTIGWSGIPTSSLTDAMTLMLILISAADSIHILSGYRFELLQGHTHKESLSIAFSKVGVSCFLTSLTTVVGFSSLWIAKPSVPIANFGFFSAIGIILAFIITITLLPLLIDIWRMKPRNIESKAKVGDFFETKFTDNIFKIVSGSPTYVVIVFTGIVITLGLGIFKLKIDTNTLEAYDESTYIRKAFEIADKNMSGTQNIDIMVDTGKVDGLYDAKVLQAMDKLQKRMVAEFPQLVVTGNSVLNILKRLNMQFNKNDPAYYRLPDTNAGVSQLLFLFNNVSPEERRRLVSEDFDAARITFTVRNTGSSNYIDLVAKAKQWGVEYLSPLKKKYPEMKVTNSGGVVSFMYLFDKIASSQLTSFGITLLVITIILLLVLGSFKMGLLALIPNLVPIIVTFGVMGWLGISLDSVVMVIAPIILGIAVDDTIHFMNKLKQVLPKSADIREAIHATLKEAGTAITFTSVIFVSGLLTMLYSSDASFQAFGYLSALALGTALLADILLVPAVSILWASRYQIVNTKTAPLSQKV